MEPGKEMPTKSEPRLEPKSELRLEAKSELRLEPKSELRLELGKASRSLGRSTPLW